MYALIIKMGKKADDMIKLYQKKIKEFQKKIKDLKGVATTPDEIENINKRILKGGKSLSQIVESGIASKRVRNKK